MSGRAAELRIAAYIHLEETRKVRPPVFGRCRAFSLVGCGVQSEKLQGQQCRPKALDLFCGAGGASMGLHRAGFDVTGIDIKLQPRYPFKFIQADALEYPLDGYNFIWASPPCQGYSRAIRHLAKDAPLLIEPIRARLDASSTPYVIENVPGAPLITPVFLCGLMFGRALYRHRLFESSWPLMPMPPHFDHNVRASAAGHFEEETFISVAGHVAPIALAEAVMDIDWMSREELAESIPPYFSEFIGKQALQFLRSKRDSSLEEMAGSS